MLQSSIKKLNVSAVLPSMTMPTYAKKMMEIQKNFETPACEQSARVRLSYELISCISSRLLFTIWALRFALITATIIVAQVVAWGYMCTCIESLLLAVTVIKKSVILSM